MNKTIHLKDNKIARLDDYEPFYLPSNEGLTLTIDNPSYDLRNGFISISNGRKKGVYPLVQTFTVPKKYLDQGFLHIDIYTKKGEQTSLQWTCFPIKIAYATPDKNIYGEKVIYDYVAALEKRVKKLEDNQPTNIF